MIDKLCRKLLSPWLLLAFSALLLVSVSFQDHISTEEGICFYTAKQWISTQAPLYTSLGDTAQPGIIFVCALFYKVFGNNIIAARLLTILAVLLAQWFVYAISCRIYCRTAGLVAMAVFGIMMSWPDITNGFFITSDLFVASLCAASLYLIVCSCDIKKAQSHYLFIACSGITLGMAVLFKQTAILSVLGMIGIYCGLYVYKKTPLLNLVFDFACLLGACAIVITSVLYILSLHGTAIRDYIFCSWSSLQYLMPDSWYSGIKKCLFTFQRRNIIVMYPCILLFSMLRNKIDWKQRVAIGFIVWFVFEWIGSTLWGLVFEFDLTQLVLVSSLLAGCSVAFLMHQLSTDMFFRNTLLLILCFIIVGIPYETIYREQRGSFLKKNRNNYAFFGSWLNEKLDGNKQVLIATPWAAQAYLYANRNSPIRFVREQYLDVQSLESEFVADFDANPPDQIVLPDEGDIPQWLRPYINEQYKRVLYTSLWIRYNCKIYQKKVSQ